MARRMIFSQLLRSQTKQFSTRSFQTGLCPSRFGTCEQRSYFELQPVRKHEWFNINQCIQKRWASQATKANQTDGDSKISIGPQRSVETTENDKDNGVVYYGPISSTIKKVKLLSLSTCCLSVSLGPVVTFMTAPDSNVILKGAVASSVIFFSASTTAALHWFVSPYIHKLRWKPGSDSFEVEMMSWLATYIPKTIRFVDVKAAETNRPFVTFKANDNFYFIDTEHCHNKALLARLTPKKPAHESALKNV